MEQNEEIKIIIKNIVKEKLEQMIDKDYIRKIIKDIIVEEIFDKEFEKWSIDEKDVFSSGDSYRVEGLCNYKTPKEIMSILVRDNIITYMEKHKDELIKNAFHYYGYDDYIEGCIMKEVKDYKIDMHFTKPDIKEEK